MATLKNKLHAALGIVSAGAPLTAAKQSGVGLLKAAKGALGGPSKAAVSFSDLAPVRMGSISASGAIGTAAMVGAAAIQVAHNEAVTGEAEENANRATPAVGLGSGKKMRKQTVRRVLRATGELR